MLNFSPEKLLLVGVIALIVLGPHRLPQAARTLGRFMAQLRQMSQNFQDEVRGALHEPAESLRSVADLRPPDVRRVVRDTISSTLNPSGAPAAAPPAPPSSAAPTAVPVVPPAPDDPSLN